MNVKLKNISSEWVDPDDAPELRDEDLARAVWTLGGKVVSEEEGRAAFAKKLRGRPAGSVSKSPKKQIITIRLSTDVLEQFKASGAGWQTKIDLALKDWLLSHRP
ncbi:BrnA antitoxin family protein [Polynucleobacter antarcticus]|uniref:BrnA antitoxin of type II toxin-antitoxin system n=1 Tax=Polynucleobacter antarcticus TaxID=1743162 RepID=A0A6M9PR31_9BURK|nr:BrnA antitoxin family protein [Polynucleobacter antarcticus]QKM62801.1 hypothetical protein DCO16_06875 [Polynucleobacter antarcticus]